MRFQIFDVEKVKLKGKSMMSKCYADFTEFMNMNVKCVKCVFGNREYASSKSAYNSMHKASRKFDFPVRVTINKGEVYLIRTDM